MGSLEDLQPKHPGASSVSRFFGPTTRYSLLLPTTPALTESFAAEALNMTADQEPNTRTPQILMEASGLA